MIIVMLRHLAEKWVLSPAQKKLKFSERELAQLIDAKLQEQEAALQKARRIYLEQKKELENLKSPALWRFGPRLEAPPEYKAEYFRRIAEKNAPAS